MYIYREKSSAFTSAKPVVRWATQPGSCIVWNTESTLMGKCPRTTPSGSLMIHSIHSSQRPAVENMCRGETTCTGFFGTVNITFFEFKEGQNVDFQVWNVTL